MFFEVSVSQVPNEEIICVPLAHERFWQVKKQQRGVFHLNQST
jgi:hypothetical protein